MAAVAVAHRRRDVEHLVHLQHQLAGQRGVVHGLRRRAARRHVSAPGSGCWRRRRRGVCCSRRLPASQAVPAACPGSPARAREPTGSSCAHLDAGRQRRGAAGVQVGIQELAQGGRDPPGRRHARQVRGAGGRPLGPGAGAQLAQGLPQIGGGHGRVGGVRNGLPKRAVGDRGTPACCGLPAELQKWHWMGACCLVCKLADRQLHSLRQLYTAAPASPPAAATHDSSAWRSAAGPCADHDRFGSPALHIGGQQSQRGGPAEHAPCCWLAKQQPSTAPGSPHVGAAPQRRWPGLRARCWRHRLPATRRRRRQPQPPPPLSLLPPAGSAR